MVDPDISDGYVNEMIVSVQTEIVRESWKNSLFKHHKENDKSLEKAEQILSHSYDSCKDFVLSEDGINELNRKDWTNKNATRQINYS
jgi:hypothetical protein